MGSVCAAARPETGGGGLQSNDLGSLPPTGRGVTNISPLLLPIHWGGSLARWPPVQPRTFWSRDWNSDTCLYALMGTNGEVGF